MFKDELKEKTLAAENVIFNYLPENIGFQQVVLDAMRYSVEAGGKRLRPILMFETYKLFGGEEKVIEPFMAAMEFIHTYSLIHDDLPAMDNDEYRRGRKTTHAVYGAGMATLAGDGLLNLAYETAVKGAIKGKELPPYDGETTNRYLAALEILTTKAGVYGMVGGQCADICAENSTEPDEEKAKETLQYIDENKTGALIESSLMVGAILGGATADQVSLMEKVGSNVGIAFQIQDDILDIEGSEAELGKPIGSDIKNGKSTYVSLYGMENAKAKVKELSDEAINILSGFDYSNTFLQELFEYLIYRTK